MQANLAGDKHRFVILPFLSPRSGERGVFWAREDRCFASPIPFTPFSMKSATDTALLERQRVDNRLHPRQRNTFNAGNRLASLLSYSSTLSLPPSFLIFLSFLLLFLLEVYLSIGLCSWIDRIFDKVSFQSVLLRSRGDCLGRRPQRTVSIPSFDSWLFTWEH